MSRVGPYLALLRTNRDFTRLYVAQLISFAGDWFATVALLGLVLEMTGSAVAASIVIVLQTAGLAFLSPLGGVLADRLDRRRLMVGADLVRIPIALVPLLARDPGTIWIALLGVFLLSAASAAFEPSSSAALPNLVDTEELSRANVLIGSAWGTDARHRCGVGRDSGCHAWPRRHFRDQRDLVRCLRRAHHRHSPVIPATARRRGC